MRVFVTGSRKWTDRRAIWSMLDESRLRIEIIIHGGANGADSIADEWAKARGVPRLPFPVYPEEWERIGKKAGPIRNARMLVEGKPDIVYAFPLPGSRGTKDMVRQARRAGLVVVFGGYSHRVEQVNE